MKNLDFDVIIRKDEDNIYFADCPAIPGCHSQGNTFEEVEKNIKEAIKLCLKVAEEDAEYRNSIDFKKINTPTLAGISHVTVDLPAIWLNSQY